MSSAELVRRAKSYFTRQAAWFERTRGELAGVKHCLDPEGLEKLAAQQARQAEEFARFEKEFKVLADEWTQAKDVAQADREAVRTLARRAEVLATELFNEFERARGAVDERMVVLRKSWNALQRGRDMLKKYRAYDDPQRGLIDRDA